MAKLKTLIGVRALFLKNANRALKKAPQLKTLKKARKLSAQELGKLLPTNKVDKVDRVINARFRGIKFVKFRGRIIPIRPKRSK